MDPRYTHGTQSCTLCHRRGATTTIHEDRWRLIQWPAYWGSSEPDTLVLGFSMGARQVGAATREHFDDVAFATHRPKLERILKTLGVRLGSQSIDATMTRWSRGIGYSSLSRCSLAQKKPGSDAWVTSGSIMKDAVEDPWASRVLRTCAFTYLTALPQSVRRVVLLGTSDPYVKGVRRLLRGVLTDFADINPVSFRADGRTWVFAVHPQQKNEVDDWQQLPTDCVSGQKRAWAQQAIARSYEGDDAEWRRGIGVRRVVKRGDVHSRRGLSVDPARFEVPHH